MYIVFSFLMNCVKCRMTSKPRKGLMNRIPTPDWLNNDLILSYLRIVEIDWQNIFSCLVLGSCDPCVSLGDVIHGKLSRILWAASLRHVTLRMWTVPCVLDEHVLNMLRVTIFLLHFFVSWLRLSFPDFLSRKWNIPRKATNITNWDHLIKLSLIGILYDSFMLHKRRPYFPWPFETKDWLRFHWGFNAHGSLWKPWTMVVSQRLPVQRRRVWVPNAHDHWRPEGRRLKNCPLRDEVGDWMKTRNQEGWTICRCF